MQICPCCWNCRTHLEEFAWASVALAEVVSKQNRKFQGLTSFGRLWRETVAFPANCKFAKEIMERYKDVKAEY
jgi:hypothetical protein